MVGIAVSLLSAGYVMAQDEQQVELDVFEQCNNWARHYCVNNLHADAVNKELQRMKQAGVSITRGKIQRVAKSTRVPLRAPQED